MSWTALRRHVDEVRGLTTAEWLRLVYAGDSIGGTHAARPAEAAALALERLIAACSRGVVADWAGCARALLDHGVALPEFS